MLKLWLEAGDRVVGNNDVVGEGGSFPEEVGPRGAVLAKSEACRMQIYERKPFGKKSGSVEGIKEPVIFW